MDAVRNLQFSVLDTHEVSALLLVPTNAMCLLVMAHGAGAGMNHSFMEAMASAHATDGVGTFRYQFPYMEQHRGVPDRQPVLTATVAAAVKTAVDTLHETDDRITGDQIHRAAAEPGSRQTCTNCPGRLGVGDELFELRTAD